MQRLEVSSAVRPVYGSLGIKRLTSIAPEDGRVSPKHVELKVHNKYSIALSW